MKTAIRVVALISTLALPITSQLLGQPATVWEMKLADDAVTNIVVGGTGVDGSVIVRQQVATTNGRAFWVAGDGRLVAELTTVWDSSRQILFLSSSQILTRPLLTFADEQWVPLELTLFTINAGVIVRSIYDLPGNNALSSLDDRRWAFTDKLAFYTTAIGDGGTFLRKWKFEGLTQPATLNLSPSANGNLTLTANSELPSQIDSSTNLLNWISVTNFSGHIEIPVQTQEKRQEIFRVQ